MGGGEGGAGTCQKVFVEPKKNSAIEAFEETMKLQPHGLACEVTLTKIQMGERLVRWITTESNLITLDRGWLRVVALVE